MDVGDRHVKRQTLQVNDMETRWRLTAPREASPDRTDAAGASTTARAAAPKPPCSRAPACRSPSPMPAGCSPFEAPLPPCSM